MPDRLRKDAAHFLAIEQNVVRPFERESRRIELTIGCKRSECLQNGKTSCELDRFRSIHSLKNDRHEQRLTGSILPHASGKPSTTGGLVMCLDNIAMGKLACKKHLSRTRARRIQCVVLTNIPVHAVRPSNDIRQFFVTSALHSHTIL